MDGVAQLPKNAIGRLAYIGMTTPDAAGLCQFYERALGFRLLTAGRLSGLDAAAGGAYRVTLGLGHEVIELLQFDRPGRFYPTAASTSDLRFQHFAIVVADMTTAYQRLCSVGGWSPISIDGPQRLPPSSGGVEAFKFRDPDGHPLELLGFPQQHMPQYWKAYSKAELFLGIDHSAISVSDSQRSIAFYQALGLRVASRSLNNGCEQALLDGLSDPDVEVTALDPPQPTPHLELLCYRSAMHDGGAALRPNDVATTRVVFESGGLPDADAAGQQTLTDPDGHHIVIVNSVRNVGATPNAGLPSASVKSESPR